MKKLLFLAFLLVAAVGMKADDKVTARVSGTTLNIALQNATTYCAFQMDIQLPQGVSATAVAAVADRLSQTGSDTEVGGTKFIVAHNTLDGNVLRVIAYNLANAQIAEAKGDILSITLSATVDDPTQITVSNIIFVNAENLNEVVLDDATGESDAIRGDVDGDTKVDVSDVVEVIKVIKQAGFSTLADVDGDNKVDIADVVEVIKIIKNNK